VAAPTRKEAWELFCEWTESDSLRKHVLGVEAAMRVYARRFGEDEELWAATGILHDLDYERHPDLETGHPRMALELFEQKGYPRELIDAVAGHVAACALVRPTGIEGMTPKSVKKKLKQPSFAAAVNRDDVRRGAEELGVDFDEHLATVIAAMEERRDELGL
jgi:putative nucleotidyltransferase with HDIG domain